MFDTTTKQNFTFKCEDCGLIVAVPFEEEEDLKDIQENKLFLECLCKGKCKVLRN